MATKDDLDVFAFYLPQFHPCDANDQFWEVGFTDWTTTKSAKPLFDGHHQPNRPSDLGYYDLTNRDTLKLQAKLAKNNGIKGFAIYHYWFSPLERALEKPINLIREDREIDIDYFICWVNTDWTKSWVGDNKTVIRKQKYSEELYELIMLDACKHFKDERYYRIGNKPVFYIHMPRAFDVSKLMNVGEKIAMENGFSGITWVAPDHHTLNDQKSYFDFLLGYPSGDFPFTNAKIFGSFLRTIKKIIPKVCQSPMFYKAFSVFDYRKYSDAYMNFIETKKSNKKYIPTLLSSWDNTPRYGRKGMVLENSDPKFNEAFLFKFFESCAKQGRRFCMIKAWNEWAEGNYLEPDVRYGEKRLQAIGKAIKACSRKSET